MAEDTLSILVVEDDQAIQALVEEALIDGGFEPDIAASGEEAVILLKGTNSRYRALVTDINLLGKSTAGKSRSTPERLIRLFQFST